MSTDLALNSARRFAAVALLALAVAGCNESARPDAAAAELAWARAALARNPALEVIGVDEKAKLFTVRERASGALHSLRLDEIAGAPVAMLTPPPAPAAAGVMSAAAPAPAPAAPASAGSADAAASEASGPGGAPPAAQVSGAADYAVQRSPGGVTITGPGVSITSVGPPAGAAARGAAAAAAVRAEAAPAGSIERRSEPLHCQGERSLHIDNQRLAFAGDGVVAERGCEVYLTNSRVEALGTAVIADASRVHVSNSTLIGGTGSLQLQNGGEAYVGGSTITGMSRRFDSSALHDLGGNQWK